MSRRLLLFLTTLAVALAQPTSGTAQGREGMEKPGGKARERRSEKAEENANAQWQEDAQRGQDRAATRRRGDTVKTIRAKWE